MKQFGPKESEICQEESESGISEIYGRLLRKKKEEDDGKGKYYTLAQHVPVDSFDNLKTEITK